MNGEFLTRNTEIAIFVLAAGGPLPTAQELDPGRVTFAFLDPAGEWKRLGASAKFHAEVWRMYSGPKIGLFIVGRSCLRGTSAACP
jgi:hypothetical protein